ncbi:MAG TPA: DUF2807 domain-containing protein [Candidatus Limnocylindria bacterium]|nr:DUF2807 domain-containing protein [Candidatus Limnocylindria bacterium]
MTTEKRSVPTFTSVAVGDGIRLRATIGSPLSVEVDAPDEILPIIETAVEDATLRVRALDAFRTAEPVEVSVVAPQLEGIALSGGSPGEVAGLDQPSLAVSLSGGARLTAIGIVEDLQAQLSGGAQGMFGELPNARAAVSVSGGSQVDLRTSEQVFGSASGGSMLNVTGEPNLQVVTSGASQVNRLPG